MCPEDELPFSSSQGWGIWRTKGIRRCVMSVGSKGNFNTPFSLAPLHKPFIFLNPCLYSADLLARVACTTQHHFWHRRHVWTDTEKKQWFFFFFTGLWTNPSGLMFSQPVTFVEKFVWIQLWLSIYVNTLNVTWQAVVAWWQLMQDAPREVQMLKWGFTLTLAPPLSPSLLFFLWGQCTSLHLAD